MNTRMREGRCWRLEVADVVAAVVGRVLRQAANSAPVLSASQTR